VNLNTVTVFGLLFLSHSKLQESDSRNQELLVEIERLRKETEELRLRRGKNLLFTYVTLDHITN